MKITDIIDRIAVRENRAVLFLPNGFEINLDLAYAKEISEGMPIEAELCKNLVQKLTINGKLIFEKRKEGLLPEMDNLLKELSLEAEDEKRTEVNLESSKILKRLLPLFKTRMNILMANNKSFMQIKDWRKELKACEMLQSIYLAFKEQGILEKNSYLKCENLSSLYPDINKLDKTTKSSVLFLVNALLADYHVGIVPEDDASVKAHILTSRVLKVTNIIGEEVRVVDLASFAEI